MKHIISGLTFLCFSTFLFSQNFETLDKVPHDIAYYRENRVTKPLVKVLYGRPSVENSEEVFGTVIPFNEVWRTGANEATEVKFYNDVIFGGKEVKAGTYVLYTVPNKDSWTIILSSNTDVLGAFQYDPLFDVAKIKLPVKKAEPLNTFSIAFKKIDERVIAMTLAWGATRVKIPLEINNQKELLFSSNSKLVKQLDRKI